MTTQPPVKKQWFSPGEHMPCPAGNQAYHLREETLKPDGIVHRHLVVRCKPGACFEYTEAVVSKGDDERVLVWSRKSGFTVSGVPVPPPTWPDQGTTFADTLRKVMEMDP